MAVLFQPHLARDSLLITLLQRALHRRDRHHLRLDNAVRLLRFGECQAQIRSKALQARFGFGDIILRQPDVR
ncbi:hypothetical protein D3C80_1966190 [compost metagenome]